MWVWFGPRADAVTYLQPATAELRGRGEAATGTGPQEPGRVFCLQPRMASVHVPITEAPAAAQEPDAVGDRQRREPL